LRKLLRFCFIGLFPAAQSTPCSAYSAKHRTKAGRATDEMDYFRFADHPGVARLGQHQRINQALRRQSAIDNGEFRSSRAREDITKLDI